MYADMISRDSGFYDAAEGMARVRARDDFAFIRESPYLSYDLTFAPCDLEMVRSSSSPKTGPGYGFAFPKGSPLTEIFSKNILEIIEDGTMAKIHRTWFVTRSQCSDKHKLAANVETIGFDDIRGVFLAFIIGLGLSFVIFGVKVGIKAAKNADICSKIKQVVKFWITRLVK